jgi:hypothetical protein
VVSQRLRLSLLQDLATEDQDFFLSAPSECAGFAGQQFVPASRCKIERALLAGSHDRPWKIVFDCGTTNDSGMMSSSHPTVITLRWLTIVTETRFLPIVVLFCALAFSALAEPPIKLDCTIRYWNDAFKKEKEHDYYSGYSTTKVAPEDIAWLRPGANPIGRFGDRIRTFGFIVLGSCKKGNLTDSTDLRSLMIKLSKVASDHGANAISYEKYGTEIYFQFLRVQDTILAAARRSNKTIAHGPK